MRKKYNRKVAHHEKTMRLVFCCLLSFVVVSAVAAGMLCRDSGQILTEVQACVVEVPTIQRQGTLRLLPAMRHRSYNSTTGDLCISSPGTGHILPVTHDDGSWSV